MAEMEMTTGTAPVIVATTGVRSASRTWENGPTAEPPATRPGRPKWEWLVLLVLPAAYLAMALILRTDGGPFWLFHAIDPSYFYLFSSLHLVDLTTPGHVAHPGTPVQVLGALVFWAMNGFAGSGAVIKAVLNDPEASLRAATTVLYVLNAVAILVAGAAARAGLGGLLPALLVQSGPFLSMIIVRHGLYMKPEPMLILAAMALAALTALALRPGRLEAAPTRYAVGFGVVAGFATALKVSAAPVFVLPLFLMWGRRTLAIYAATAVLAFFFFTLPAVGAYGEFFGWIEKIAMGSGFFGQGPQTVIDFADYPHQVVRLASRPIQFVPWVLALVALAVVWRRRRGGHSIPRLATRALGGAVLAQFFHVLVTAKHPDAHYLLPSLVLAGLVLALLYRVVSQLGMGSPRTRRLGWQGTVLVFSGLLIAQGVAVVKQDFELRNWRTEAERIDNEAFARCTRIYVQFASDPDYALMYADYISHDKLADAVAPLIPENVYWFDSGPAGFRDAHGPADIVKALGETRCAFIRGTGRSFMDAYLAREVPGVVFHDSCSTRQESVLTAGVDCKGNWTGR